MHTTQQQHTTADVRVTVPAQERRTRHRLRDLCDEVIASHRAATGYQLFTDEERSEAHALLGRLVPAIGRRPA